MDWLLLLVIHSGAASHNDDVSVTTARFYNQSACVAAGAAIDDKLKWTIQNVKYVCVKDAAK